ncbi:hypothetical protein GCM10022232_93560 [Streptomyces plumbiresistens]|uniref:Uncharacterized protein n=2 Tax=Streptomyces plumbiresistens TaxID=511811 RepID=A0ABP7TXY9_9ACTN
MSVHLDAALDSVHITDASTDAELVNAGKLACQALRDLDDNFWNGLQVRQDPRRAAETLDGTASHHGNFALLPISADLLSAMGYGPLPEAREFIKKAQDAFIQAHVSGPAQDSYIRNARKLVDELADSICRLAYRLEKHIGGAEQRGQDRLSLQKILVRSGNVFAALLLGMAGNFCYDQGKQVYREHIRNEVVAARIEEAERRERIPLEQMNMACLIGRHEVGRQAHDILEDV